ncbi:hypothetical protein ACIP5Y_11770 [Nocardia sp. NPDC088792]|uniref:hypothetical protein n=1 Tax=Nocardia sp. NPDC088792 TaxID=3364332 RepID=UPI003830746D
MILAMAQDPEERNRMEVVRALAHRVGDGVFDVVHPWAGQATVPVMMLIPLLIVLAAWLVGRHLRV